VAGIEKQEANGEIMNLGSTHEISILELAHLIKRLADTPEPIKLKFVPYSSFSGGKYEDVMRRIPDVSKARKLLGFQAAVDLEDGLFRTITWQRDVQVRNRTAS
jgi:UDP-glucose 4-epimerase